MTLRRLAFLLCAILLSSGAAARGPGDFDYYVLSLSWSPAYCLLHAGDRAECDKGYGFVLHGLWPQYEQGGYPKDCGSTEQMSEVARRVGAITYPSPYLAQHEWQSHGRCTDLSALDYFRAADKAFTSVTIPRAFEAPAAPLRLGLAEILTAFRTANPKYKQTGMVLICKDAALAEIRFCLDKNLNPRRCGAGVSSQCRARTITVQPVD
jgi:ribonuclease T2